MNRFLAQILALGVVFFAAVPALDAGFLADDFYMGQRIAAQAAAEPGAIAAVRAAFVHRWTEHFDVFRPLTIMTLQADYAVHGPRGGRHHLTNIALWLVLAALFGSLAAKLARAPSPLFLAAATLLFGLHPAGVEALGWLVAREDLITALFALLALRLWIVRPDRPLRWTAALLPAFLAKETAIVLPPLLLWTDLVLRPEPEGATTATPLGRRLGRHLPAFALLALYFGARTLLFGRPGGTYGGRPYAAYLERPDLLGHVATSVAESTWRLLVPVNHGAWTRITGLPAWLPVAVLLPCFVAILLAGFRGAGRALLRLAVAGLPWIAGPLVLLVIPLRGVGPDLDLSRFLLLPLIAWLLPVAVAGARVLGRPARWPRLAFAVLLLASFALLRINLDAFENATRLGQTLLAEVTSGVPAGGRVLLLRATPPGADSGLDSSLIFHEGVHLLSAGIFSAALPPYQPAPGIVIEPVPPSGERHLAALCGLGRDDPRPWLSAFEPPRGPGGRPAFRRLACGSMGGPTGWALGPPHGTVVERTWEPRFEVRGPLSGPTAGSAVRIIVTDLEGRQAVAQAPLDAALTDPGTGSFTLAIPGERFRLQSATGQDLGATLTGDMLRRLPSPVLAWWAEITGPAGSAARSPYAILALPAATP